MREVTIGVLGPVTAFDAAGGVIGLRGPRHRAVLARLVIARGRVVPVRRLVDDLWTVPPDDAIGAVRTFVAALRPGPGTRPRPTGGTAAARHRGARLRRAAGPARRRRRRSRSRAGSTHPGCWPSR